MSAALAPEPDTTPAAGLPVYVGGPELPEATDPCRCGHGKAAHEHWRRGSDCGACGAAECPRFTRPSPAARTLRAFLRGRFR